MKPTLRDKETKSQRDKEWGGEGESKRLRDKETKSQKVKERKSGREEG